MSHGLGDPCLRCGRVTNYQWVVQGGGILCTPCVCLVDPDRYGGDPEMRELHAVHAQRSDEEWEAMGWRPPATVTALSQHSEGGEDA